MFVDGDGQLVAGDAGSRQSRTGREPAELLDHEPNVHDTERGSPAATPAGTLWTTADIDRRAHIGGLSEALGRREAGLCVLAGRRCRR